MRIIARWRLIPLISLILMVLSLSNVSHTIRAKGIPDKIIIRGLGLTETTITDRTILTALELGQLEDFKHGAISAPLIDGGYELIRYYKNDDGTFWPFDHLHFFSARHGGRSVIFYDGLGVNGGGGWSEYDGKWFYPTPQGESTMRALLNTLVPHPLAPSLLLLQNGAGTIHLFNVYSLADTGGWRAAAGWSYLSGANVLPDGRTLFFNTYQNGRLQQAVLDTSAGTVCQITEQNRFVAIAANGQLIFENTSYMVNAGSDSAWQDRLIRLEAWNAQPLKWLKAIPLPADYIIDAFPPPEHFFPSPDGQWIYSVFRHDNGLTIHIFDVAAQKFVDQVRLENLTLFNLEDFQATWDRQSTRFYVTDGSQLFAISPTTKRIVYQNALSLPGDAASAKDKAFWLTLAAAHDDKVYLYYRLGWHWLNPEEHARLQNGIFVVDASTGKTVARWQALLPFAQVIAGTNQFYGISAQKAEEPSVLYALNPTDGSILASQTLDIDWWSLAYAWFDTNVIPTSGGIQPTKPCYSIVVI